MTDIAIIGGGFAGMAAAWELRKNGHEVTIYEASDSVGGLAGSFEIKEGVRIEKFYHHWFTSDTAILQLIDELGLSESIEYKASTNGLYYVNSTFRLSSPLDLLAFKPLPFHDRVRTGLMALYARSIKNWKSLESITAEEWIRKVGGNRAYEVIWQPLLKGKFGSESSEISAVWFWNKLKLRGSSRDKKGDEQLLYYSGGFGALTDELEKALLKKGVSIKLNSKVSDLIIENSKVKGLQLEDSQVSCSHVLSTIPLPLLLEYQAMPEDYRLKYSKVRFLGNCCLVLRLKQSLSDTYWLNVADPDFPFVGIIEHTNFDDKVHYDGENIAYISKYLPTSDDLFQKTNEEFRNFCIPYIKKIFPDFEDGWIIDSHLWKASYSQPVITKHYSTLIPPTQGPFENFWQSTMAQVYPQDRGTNYAVSHGRDVAKSLLSHIS